MKTFFLQNLSLPIFWTKFLWDYTCHLNLFFLCFVFLPTCSKIFISSSFYDFLPPHSFSSIICYTFQITIFIVYNCYVLLQIWKRIVRGFIAPNATSTLKQKRKFFQIKKSDAKMATMRDQALIDLENNNNQTRY